jgi:hypothetical protein
MLTRASAFFWLETNLWNSQTRSFAAVLFRRVASRTRKDPTSSDAAPRHKEIFLTLEPNQREVIRTKLLQSLASETVTAVRNKVSDAVAEVARQYTEDGTWKYLWLIHDFLDTLDLRAFRNWSHALMSGYGHGLLWRALFSDCHKLLKPLLALYAHNTD